MEHAKLQVALRQGTKKGVCRKLRAKGRIPGVIYGKGMENILIDTDPKETETLFSRMDKLNQLLELEVPGHGRFVAMLREYQADVLTRKFTHLDFIKIDLTKKMHVEVPIQVVGKSEGVKEGGILDVIRREITVICLPTAIPKHIEVDVTALKIGQSIHLHEVKLPPGVELPRDTDFTLISVAAPKEEKTAAPGEAVKTEPEVLTAKKPAEGEEAKKEGKSEKK